MIFMDLQKIYDDMNIPNKYILALVLAARARQLSERKTVRDGFDEKYISMALNDIENGKISYKLVDNAEVDGVENEQLEENE